MNIEENISAKDFSTFRIGGTIRYFIVAKNIEEIQSALKFAEDRNLPMIIIGEGSNTIWTDTEHAVLVLRIDIQDIEVISDTVDNIIWKIGAGLNWDTLVQKSVQEGYSGIECMSGIPGSVGAAPVQNIGAYGQEIRDTLVHVDVYDLIEKKEKTLTSEECSFSYRNSIFKSTEKGRYIITHIIIILSKKIIEGPHYESLQKYFTDQKMSNPTVSDIREAILKIRSIKLPDPILIPNCGSFFENPIISIDQVYSLKEKYPDVKIFPTDRDDFVKISAGWLIEKAGLKGKDFGNIGIYENNALVLINKGNATYDELLQVKNEIMKKVKDMFEIELEMEPNVI